MLTVELEDFSGGLNTATGPLDGRYALDCLNVTYGRAVSTRAGYGAFTSSANAYDYVFGWQKTDGTKQLLAGRGTTTEAFNTSGTSVTTEAKSAAVTGAAAFAAPGSEYVYLANGTDTVYRWDGTTFTAPGAAMPKAKYLCVTPWDNRLVACGYGTGAYGPAGATVNPAHVHFSDERNPEAWTAANNVQVKPGDGEQIMGCVTWRDYVFVFKETKFFVFTEPTTNSSTAVTTFHRREVTGQGPISADAITVTPQGIYFLNRTGVYFTSGADATRVSGDIDALFGDVVPKFCSSGIVNQAHITKASATYYRERVYFAVPMDGGTTCNRVLVFDPKYSWWSIFDIPAAHMCVWRPGDSNELMFALASGNKVYRHRESEDDDNGTAINSFSRTAWIDVGAERKLWRATVWGAGQLTVTGSVDYDPSVGSGTGYDLTGTTDTWDDGAWDGGGTWGPDGGSYRRHRYSGFSARGWLHSITFTGNTAGKAIAVERATLHFTGNRRGE